MGSASNTAIEDVYAQVNMDYSPATVQTFVRMVGGLIGKMNHGSTLNRAYVVGPVNIDAENKGAAVGYASATVGAIPTQGIVIWNKDVSLTQDSALGLGAATNEMSSVSFWQGFGFNSGWTLMEGKYPDLL